jgi:hypothetical protein
MSTSPSASKSAAVVGIAGLQIADHAPQVVHVHVAVAIAVTRRRACD